MTRLPFVIVLLAAWVLMGLCSGVLMVEGMAVAILFLTCGVGMITFVIPTMWLYATGAMPGVLVWAARAPLPVAVVVSALGLVGTAFLPNLAARTARDHDAARLAEDDRTGPLPRAPRAVRLVHDGASLRPEHLLRDTACDAACQTLLYGGEAELVEVLAVAGRDGTVSTTWRREARAVCDDPFARADDALPAVRRALAVGDCLVAEPGRLLPDAPWIRLQTRWELDVRDEATSPALYPIDRVLVLTAGPAGSTLDAPVLRHTAVHGQLLQRPTAIVPDSGGMQMSLALWREVDVVRPTSWEEGLREAFGHVVAPLPEPGPPDLAFLARMLDRPGDTPFGRTAEDLVREAIVARQEDRGRPLSADELAVLDRLLRDPRLLDLALATHLVERDEAALRALLPALVVRVGLPYREDLRHTQSQVSWQLARLDPEALRPHVPALLDALRTYPGWGTDALLTVLPLLTDDVAPDLAAALDDERRRSVALKGVCNASEAVAAPLLDRVEAVARAERELPPAAVQALRRHGRASAAEALAARLDDRDRRRLERELEQLAVEVPPGGCRR